VTDENARANAEAELTKARAALRAAHALADLSLRDDAASRLYYAAFHLVSAALLCLGVQAQTHRGVASLLGQHLVRPGLLPTRVSRDFATLLGLRGQDAGTYPTSTRSTVITSWPSTSTTRTATA
jgi:uncharacterized protein (UPF0332 family)